MTERPEREVSDYIRNIVAQAPEPTDEQRDILLAAFAGLKPGQAARADD